MLVEELNVLQVRRIIIHVFKTHHVKPLDFFGDFVWQIIPTERHRLKLVNTLRR